VTIRVSTRDDAVKSPETPGGIAFAGSVARRRFPVERLPGLQRREKNLRLAHELWQK
jgi:hypothetical protein